MTANCNLVILNKDEVLPFAGTRLDVFLTEKLQRSRAHVQKLLKGGLVDVDPHPNASASHRLRAGDSITIRQPPDEPLPSAPAGEAMPIDILYEDEFILALNKAPGIVVHPAVGHRTGTLVNALVHHFGTDLAIRGGAARPGLVHRLDKDTSGVLLIAKTEAAHEKLALAFAERETRKLYRALCWGKFRRLSGSCREAIGRHHIHRQKMAVMKQEGRGRAAWTDYRVLQSGHHGAEVECVLHTGRTHQIRVHLAHLAHPIWGDLVYGKKHPLADGFAPERQMLHAALLEVAHPITGKPMCFEAPVPTDFIASRGRLLEE